MPYHIRPDDEKRISATRAFGMRYSKELVFGVPDVYSSFPWSVPDTSRILVRFQNSVFPQARASS